ncbi:uncharacterized protein EV420DRAFT_1766373 [Desarmillaria tabescens]|uniref:Yeast cell wall synthesis Kre9/Knh1-like N-terminal domain-containing protein n=1 Tax=Armillaria tabescens TaxID=1929756 RepID=A0AA39JYL2_ARMTA|nr:uncharacterized protein EV420DRAFT_1766373 [Desarmillaria tabescens]KAK0451326.1 hypothetical protein EV420DRAFT_1766373 [Desarmillaria tabescens]
MSVLLLTPVVAQAILTWLVLFILVSSLPTANASIYPTQPIAATVYNVGQPAVLNWRSTPKAKEIRRFKVELFAGNHTYIETLARNVHTQLQTYNLYLSPQLKYEGSDYTMRWISESDRENIVYTSHFTIAGIPDLLSPSSDAFAKTAAATKLALQATATQSETGGSPSCSSTGAACPGSTVYANPLDTTGSGDSHPYSAAHSRRFDARLFFVLWPAIVGFSMAL